MDSHREQILHALMLNAIYVKAMLWLMCRVYLLFYSLWIMQKHAICGRVRKHILKLDVKEKENGNYNQCR